MLLSDLNEKQKEAVLTENKRLLILAGAGSGKTKTRRLFYVALTRAKDELYLLTELGSESRFIDEIPKEFYALNKTEFKNIIMPTPVCTQCGTEIREFYKFCPTCGVNL
jgi:superfamily I DNA/RNA helicase